MHFSNTLIHWYLHNKRDLPWRNTSEPYYIWLSEIILQQTRVAQGTAYYLKFVEHFPTIQALAKAKESQVLKLWQGLGYYSRARNLHFSAKYIVNELEGVFPNTYAQLLKLKGVGDYTASAIASICYHQPTAVVDGNVYRVLARYFGVHTAINSTQGIKEFKQLAQQMLAKKYFGTHNQAIMEFGARMCKPQNPNCNACPLANSCMALSKNTLKILPVKERKLKIKKRYFNYLVIHTQNNHTKIQKRDKGIWQNLYEFPLIETTSEIDEKELIAHPLFNKEFKNNNTAIKLFNTKATVHKLTHQHIYTKFWVVKITDSAPLSVSWHNIETFPVSVLIDKFIKQYKSNLFF